MLALLRGIPTSQAHEGESSDTVNDAVPTFDEVYLAHFDYVWQTARRLGVRVDEIDDTVQEVFLTVHKLLPRYEPRNAIRGWIYAIVARTVLHDHRTNRRRNAPPEHREVVDELPDSSARGPEASAEDSEHIQLLERLLDELDAEKRAVFVLAAFEQRSLSEIAAILDINRNTAASRLRTAREQIQTSLERHQARDQWKIK